MKILTLGLALLLPAALLAQEQHTLVRNYDLNVPVTAATNNAIVTVVNLTNTTLTLAAQPDSPRNLTVTIVDTTPGVNAGTVTITGTDVNDAALVEVISIAGGAAVYTGASVFKSITSIVVAAAAVLGGAGDETIKVGSGSIVAPIYCSTSDGTQTPGTLAKTTGSSTTVTSAATSNPLGARVNVR